MHPPAPTSAHLSRPISLILASLTPSLRQHSHQGIKADGISTNTLPLSTPPLLLPRLRHRCSSCSRAVDADPRDSMSRSVDLLSSEGFRMDGRKPSEVRRLACRWGIFQQADGSAYFEMGNTRVLAAVYGPHEVRATARTRQLHDRAIVNCQYSMATFSTSERKRRPRGDFRSLEITANVREVFETAILTQLYPHSQIDIFLEVLQSDGSNYAACINAATIALVHAGISLKDMVCASSAGLIDKSTIIDVNHMEETVSNTPVLTVALLPKSKEVLSMESTGRLGLESLQSVMDAATDGCLKVYEAMRDSVLQFVSESKRE